MGDIIKFAAVQLCSTGDVTANNHSIEHAVRKAATAGAKVISLPEAANILLKDNMRYPQVCVAENEDTTLALCRSLASELHIWLHTGSLLVRTEDGKRVWNRSHLISPEGNVVSTYDKLHTFDVKLGNGGDFQESLAVAPGEQAPIVVELDKSGLKLGFSICYDLRFAYLFRALAHAGANVLMIPASFSVVTGPLHWEVLLKARAIETGSYVIAAGQCGERDGVRVFGQSRIISPFGEVLAAAGDEPDIIYADLDLDLIKTTRERLPCLQQDVVLKPVKTITAHA
ncbi:carbon-nitrogen hydrolase family protein [Brucellaceae bacterium C25G]